MKRAYCDFCTCSDCVNGPPASHKMLHAQTVDGRWICEVCFNYEVCLGAPDSGPDGPCNAQTCKHRPRLKGGWVP